MGYVLGVDLGTSRTAAAVWRAGRVSIVPLSDHASTMPSTVYLRDGVSGGAGVLVGEAARRRGADDPARLARDFKRRFGDETPLVLGGHTLTPDELSAAVLRHVLTFVAEREGGPPDKVVIAHPANWGAYRRELLGRQLADPALPPAQLVTEPDAAAAHYAASERLAVGDVVAVYDLGGGTFDATVLRRTAAGFGQIGESKGLERVGGVDFDEAVFQHVIERSGLDQVTLADEHLAALHRLRDDCRAAKEALSDDDEATVPVSLAGVDRRIVVTRGELESMIRPSLAETVRCLRTAIMDSGVRLENVATVLMVGGSSRIDLARELVRLELGRPVALISHPKECVALGAAAIGAETMMGGVTAPAYVAPGGPPQIAGGPPLAATTAAPARAPQPHRPTVLAPAVGAAVRGTPPRLPGEQPVGRYVVQAPVPPSMPPRGRASGVGVAAALALVAGAVVAVLLVLNRRDDRTPAAAPPVTAPAGVPVTAAARAAAVQASPTTPPVAAPAPAPAPAQVSVAEATFTFHRYIDLLDQQRLDEAFSLLTPRYQAKHHSTKNPDVSPRNYFIRFWSGFTTVTADSESPVGSTPPSQTLRVVIGFVAVNGDTERNEADMTFVRDQASGAVLIDQYDFIRKV